MGAGWVGSAAHRGRQAGVNAHNHGATDWQQLPQLQRRQQRRRRRWPLTLLPLLLLLALCGAPRICGATAAAAAADDVAGPIVTREQQQQQQKQQQQQQQEGEPEDLLSGPVVKSAPTADGEEGEDDEHGVAHIAEQMHETAKTVARQVEKTLIQVGGLVHAVNASLHEDHAQACMRACVVMLALLWLCSCCILRCSSDLFAGGWDFIEWGLQHVGPVRVGST
eukprot:352952-Chlamydomonas_euryale.AAC.7